MSGVVFPLAAKVPRSEGDRPVGLGGSPAHADRAASPTAFLLESPIGEIDADRRKIVAARLLRLAEICADPLRPMRTGYADEEKEDVVE